MDLMSSMVDFLMCMIRFRSIQKEFQLLDAFFPGFRGTVDIEDVIVDIHFKDFASVFGDDGADQLNGLFSAEFGHDFFPDIEGQWKKIFSLT